jgi:hypothetical protein
MAHKIYLPKAWNLSGTQGATGAATYLTNNANTHGAGVFHEVYYPNGVYTDTEEDVPEIYTTIVKFANEPPREDLVITSLQTPEELGICAGIGVWDEIYERWEDTNVDYDEFYWYYQYGYGNESIDWARGSKIVSLSFTADWNQDSYWDEEYPDMCNYIYYQTNYMYKSAELLHRIAPTVYVQGSGYNNGQTITTVFNDTVDEEFIDYIFNVPIDSGTHHYPLNGINSIVIFTASEDPNPTYAYGLSSISYYPRDFEDGDTFIVDTNGTEADLFTYWWDGAQTGWYPVTDRFATWNYNEFIFTEPTTGDLIYNQEDSKYYRYRSVFNLINIFSSWAVTESGWPERFDSYLKAYWKMEESGNNNRSDTVGGRTLNYTSGTFAQITGMNNYACHATQNTCQLTAGHHTDLSATTNYAIAFWIKMDSEPDTIGNEQVIIQKGDMFKIYFPIYSNQLYCKVKTTDGSYISHNTNTAGDYIADGDWHHICMIFTSSDFVGGGPYELQMYFDGGTVWELLGPLEQAAQVGSFEPPWGGDYFSSNYALEENTDPLVIGNSGGTSFIGKIDELGIWKGITFVDFRDRYGFVWDLFLGGRNGNYTEREGSFYSGV